jgi:2-C-methyl-D-erythritol 4-phosphate cytidylyltransferase/2-C-methyl-D-erythritol 2,4-cyclodiphosphate synthase
MRQVRVGQGFDAHRYQADEPLVLCGVTLPGEPGLEGHSDADVGLHAVADAIFGALARGDIGDHFPDADPRWKDADSTIFVARAIEMAEADGFVLVNCDLTFVGEIPRIARYREQLRESLAGFLGMPRSTVSVKATTTEGLGFVGRAEGLVALAVVLLMENDRDE